MINKRFEESSLYLLQRAFLYGRNRWKKNGFYKITQDFIDLIRDLGGQYKDAKERPVFCCVKDKYIKDLFWAIPTSDLSHRTPEQIEKVNTFCSLNHRDIRWAYYHMGHTNRQALYRISNCFPIIDKYVDAPYTSQGKHLVLASKNDIEIIRNKLSRILLHEKMNPNKYEQHITTIKEHLMKQLGIPLKKPSEE